MIAHMCGFAWIVGPEADDGAIGRMTDRLRHRGPDAQATQALDGCQIGHARLSIIDLVTGDQPMSDASGRLTITFNGEIYNYRDLRTELTRLGANFRTSSDTEVLLEGWKIWGRDLLDRVRGMFSFAIWNADDRSLFAARDLFGEKPLYYAVTPNGTFVAASEMKGVLASGLIEPRLSLTAVDAFLALGYVPPDRTIYENVFVLPPAHCLLWRAGAARVERYWRPRFDTRRIGLAEAANELRRLMSRAVERQLVADVPVGAFLSGGLDSSTIVALMRRHSSAAIKTFAVRFGDDINELPYARAVAQRYGTDHHELDLGRPNVAEMFLRMTEVYDEPFADTSHIPTFQLCAYARQFGKVMLSGDGADELFGGYWWYASVVKSESVRLPRLQWILLRAIRRLRRRAGPALAWRSHAAGLAARWKDPWDRTVVSTTVMDNSQRRRLWGERGPSELFSPDGVFRPDAEVSGLNRAFHFDLTSFLPGDILVKVDRAAMAHGLETRAPFLDRDVVEFALTLPESLKVTTRETKRVMREAFRDLWPEEIHQRPKQGFGSPIHVWMQSPELQELIRHVLRPQSRLREILPAATARDFERRGYTAWVLLTLGVWLERRVTPSQLRVGETAVESRG